MAIDIETGQFFFESKEEKEAKKRMYDSIVSSLKQPIKGRVLIVGTGGNIRSDSFKKLWEDKQK